MFRDWKKDAAIIVLFGLAYLLATLLISDGYYLQIATLIPIWALLALSWNILGGYAGFVSFGHAAFFGLGAYVVVAAEHHFGITPWIGIPAAAAVGVIAGLIVGYPTFRLQGHYFALAMLAYPLALLYLFEWGGYQEISIPMRREAPIAHMQFSDPRAYCVIAVVLMLGAMLASLFIERSRFGLALVAIRQDERAAEAAGFDTWRWKMYAMAISGMLAAIAGGLYAVIIVVITPPTVFGLLTSAQALILTLFGGAGALWGPVIGAMTLVPAVELLHTHLGEILPGIQGVVLGLAIILITIVTPGGLYWWARSRFGFKPAPIALPAPAPVAKCADVLSDRAKPILRVNGVAKSFGGVRALQDVNFEVHQGGVLGIIGPNGAGKTTLFDVLNGFTKPETGTVEYAGTDVTSLRPNKIAAIGVSRTFQVARIFAQMSVTENILTGAWSGANSSAEAMARTANAIEFVGLSDRADAEASSLTNREVRLLELARALAGNPSMLLLDETLAGLSRDDVADVIAVVRRIADIGVTVIIIEHTMHAMLQIADRLLVLDHGKVLTTGLPAEVLKDAAVIEAYLGHKWVARHAAG
jgi:ABC-type branched-subunit amino acid transport system ATPase component/ABC-type branched-subunit amino acid transport system permease subunit